jgi:hypothetical protein
VRRPDIPAFIRRAIVAVVFDVSKIRDYLDPTAAQAITPLAIAHLLRLRVPT